MKQKIDITEIESIVKSFRLRTNDIRIDTREIRIWVDDYKVEEQYIGTYICIKRNISIETEEDKENLRLKNILEIENELKEKLMELIIDTDFKQRAMEESKALESKIEKIREKNAEKAKVKFEAWKNNLELDENGSIKIHGLIGMEK